MGSYTPGRRFSPPGRPERDAEGRRPREPGMTEVSSDRMSPKRLSAEAKPVSLRRNNSRKITALTENDTVELFRVCADKHGSTIYKLVIEGYIRELLRKHLCNCSSPESASSEYVCLIDGVNSERRVRDLGECTSQSRYPSDLLGRVGTHVDGRPFLTLRYLCSVTEVNTTDELSEDNDFGTLDDMFCRV